MIRILLAGALVALAACSDPRARCDEAIGLYDQAPGVWAGALTATACAG